MCKGPETGMSSVCSRNRKHPGPVGWSVASVLVGPGTQRAKPGKEAGLYSRCNNSPEDVSRQVTRSDISF